LSAAVASAAASGFAATVANYQLSVSVVLEACLRIESESERVRDITITIAIANHHRGLRAWRGDVEAIDVGMLLPALQHVAIF
jgi:hypothetical protein